MKSKEKYLPILLFSCVALGVMIGGMLNFPKTNFNSKNSHQAKINKLINFINSDYVDDVNSDSIVDLTVNSILEKLDPHSVYLPASEQTTEAEIMKGDFVGIGINFYVYNDTVAVVNTIPNGPAEKAGIMAGDRILFAGKSKLFGKKVTTDMLYNKLRGEAGSKVNLTIYRKSPSKKLTIPVIRNTIPIKSVDVALMLNSKTGYIKIERFAENTANEFNQNLIKLKKNGALNIVVDLRGNGGGFLESAVSIADEFLPEDELIVFTKNKKGFTNKTFATNDGIFEKGKVFILIDENSASASEILAGAIQDNDRGTIIGRRSFGKGLVQREIDFEDGSAVRLTTARYYTPSGRSIQKPYVKGDGESYYHEYEARFESGELFEKDKIKVADSLKFKTKKGRTVYGGGGIVPDIFVPLEVKKGDENLSFILNSGVLGHFVFEILDKSRQNFEKLTYTDFIKKYENDFQYVNDFKKYLDNAGVTFNLEENKLVVKKHILAELARQLFGDTKYYQVILKNDPMIQQALK
ncbi:MAG: S41 family peptidase [Flavobacteriaceae bacterium]